MRGQERQQESGFCPVPSPVSPHPLAGSLISLSNLIPLPLPTAKLQTNDGRSGCLKHPPGTTPSLHHLCFCLPIFPQSPLPPHLQKTRPTPTQLPTIKVSYTKPGTLKPGYKPPAPISELTLVFEGCGGASKSLSTV